MPEEIENIIHDLFQKNRHDASIWFCNKVLKANKKEICEVYNINRFQLHRITQRIQKTITNDRRYPKMARRTNSISIST